MLEMELVFRVYVPKYHNSKNRDRLEHLGTAEEGSINRRLIRAKGVARLSTCQTGFTSVRSQYSSRFAIQFQFGRKWIPAVNFAAERKRRGKGERFAMQLCDRDESFNPVCAATGKKFN